MQYEHPHITVTSHAPGHYLIDNLPACRVLTDEGIVVAPSSCYISPEVPSDLLRAVLAEREGGKGEARVEDSDKPADKKPERRKTGKGGNE